MSVPQEVDIIIAGGGAAGCVIAGRLAAADPNISIAVIETGKNNLNDPSVIHPAKYLTHLRPDSTTARFYVGRKSEALAGRSPIVPVGNILGGGSSINFLMYTRASASDYDDWKTEGWSSKELLPLLQKTETHTMGNCDPSTHGYEGPLKVSYGGYRPSIMNEYLDVAKNRGYECNPDIQDLASSNAFTEWAKWIDPKTGRRQDTAHGYLHPQAGNPNVHVICDSHVSKVLIEDGKAVGVEFVPAAKPEGEVSTNTIKARKLVVVSAGTLGSPQILERSGIGAAHILEKAGIEVKVDLPGVGTNYQDHQLILPAYKVAPETDTHDDFLKGIPEVTEKALMDFETSGKGKLTTNFIDCGGKIRPTQKEIDQMGPSFQKLWNEYFKDAEDKPVMFAGIINAFLGDHSLVPPGKYITVGTYLEYPASRGFIHVKSTDPYEAPDFDPQFNTEEADLQANVWGYKLGRELVRRMPCFRGEPDFLQPKFAANSACRAQDIDVETSGSPDRRPRQIEDLVYSDEDNKAVEQWIRENVNTTWHSMGTLAMKPKAEGGVVDSRLNVHGIKGLKIGDLSICPSNVGSNTYSTAILVGEKAAVLIGEDLGIANV
ncbi:hypothetical protein RUND412_007595 [Rhizina undulata]